MSSVAVIDYGMGNLHSIVKALQHAAPEIDVVCVSDADSILRADRVVFPGVGAIRDCMQALNQLGLSDVIQQVAKSRPLLGICLGMQALLSDSEENGGIKCLDVFFRACRTFPRIVKRQRRKFPENSAHGLE